MTTDAKTERVSDNAAERRFELPVDGKLAFLTYKRTETTITLVHTEVPEELRGRGVGGALVDGAVARAQAEGLRITVVCPFAREHLEKHPTR